VRARDRLFGGLEIGQQPPLLNGVEDIAKPHGGVAGESRGRLLQRAIAPVFGQRRQRFLNRGCGPAGWHLDRY
jgi:hypothetical protein